MLIKAISRIPKDWSSWGFLVLLFVLPYHAIAVNGLEIPSVVKAQGKEIKSLVIHNKEQLMEWLNKPKANKGALKKGITICFPKEGDIPWELNTDNEKESEEKEGKGPIGEKIAEKKDKEAK